MEYNIKKFSNDLFSSSSGITMVDKEHIIFLTNYIKTHNCNKMVEVGVAKGGCIAFSALANPNMIIYGFDSWEGMPSITLEDEQRHKIYENVAWSKIEDVYNTFKIINADMKNVKLVKGFIENTLDNELLTKLENIDILRLDVDWYNATKFSLNKLYDKVVKNGLIIIDDYGFNNGCKIAVDNFRRENNINNPLLRQGNSVSIGYWIK
jgi:O-methyltransferase